MAELHIDEELIELSHTVNMDDRSSPHTLVSLLDNCRVSHARELSNARKQWPETTDAVIIEYKQSLVMDLAKLEKAIARIRYKIAQRGF